MLKSLSEKTFFRQAFIYNCDRKRLHFPVLLTTLWIFDHIRNSL